MTLKQEIIDELREKLELSDTTRKSILDQLALKDASIDKNKDRSITYDEYLASRR